MGWVQDGRRHSPPPAVSVWSGCLTHGLDLKIFLDAYSCFLQGRSHRGGHEGRVPRAPYHVPLHQNDNNQFVLGAYF